MEKKEKKENKDNKYKYLVTGASGCLGASLVSSLVQKKCLVRIFIPTGTWHPFLDKLDIEVIYGDITKEDEVVKAIQDCNYIYHVAGIVSYNVMDNDLMYKVNYLGTKNVLEAAKKLNVKKVVVTASTAGIGIPNDKNSPLSEHSEFNLKKYRKIMYMYSKYLCIEECEKYAKDGLNVSMVSPTTFIGQGDIAMHMGKVIKKIKEGKMIFAPPGGNSFISVDDIVEAHQLVMEKGKSGENYIFSDENLTYLQTFNIIAQTIKSKEIKITIPLAVLPITKAILLTIERTMQLFEKRTPLPAAALDFSFKYRYFDSSKARNELCWKPKVTFKEAVKKAVEFYEDSGLLKP
ncbi:NAD-dependent epimerase/dehydratase family protein [Candidatus Woesearchaeota archaeon]|nr:NAD-dependent epimerase/dehydratase family protein [Candidatus Woesearchaeota archaeon]